MQIFVLDTHNRTNKARGFMKLMSAEVDSVRICIWCHINANSMSMDVRKNWFKLVCEKPHLIIWAQKKNAKYWPAKVMTVENPFVEVRFFGSDHLNSNVHMSKCFLYSEKSPSKSHVSNPKKNDQKADYRNALKVNSH